MPLSSMTGYAKTSKQIGDIFCDVELKSVNGKGLDVRVRAPSMLEGWDIEAKKIISRQLTRGTVFLNISIDHNNEAGALTINEERLEILKTCLVKDGVKDPQTHHLLGIKGIVELKSQQMSDDTVQALKAELLEALRDVVGALTNSRKVEGRRIENLLCDQLKEMDNLVSAAESIAKTRPQRTLDRFRKQLELLLASFEDLPEERLIQEMALLAIKADITEEIDRLNSHMTEACDLIASGKPVGRKVDFLCQELNREANTLCSKSGDKDLTRIGLDLKVLIDQFREQIQNIE